MDESIIIRVIRGEANLEENKMVLEWIKKSPENLNFFSQQKMLWSLSTLPLESAPKEEFALFNELLKTRENKGVEQKSLSKINWKVTSIFSIAASIILLVALFTGVFNRDYPFKTIESEAGNLVSKINQRSLYTDKGVKGKVTLPDGSVVWLNSDSKITYPDIFANDKREVHLSGEAFFEVKSDSLKPMHITTAKNFTIEVLGTSFSIKSYDNDSESRATLYTGSIKLITNKGSKKESTVMMVPNESAIITKERTAKLSKIDTHTNVAWMKGELVFEDTPMAEVLKVLERWYGKQFEVKGNDFYNYKLNASFKSESLTQVLEIIDLCTSTNHKIIEDTVIFFK